MRSALIYALIVLAVVPPATAQPLPPADTWRAFAQQLKAGQFINVRLETGSRVKGHFLQVTSDTLRMQPKTRIPVPVRDIPLTDIASIHRQKEGWSPGQKVLIGLGVAGAAVFTLFLVAISQIDD